MSMNNYRAAPIDPGYGAIGQALGAGMVGGAHGYIGGQDQQRLHAIRQAMMDQQSQEFDAQQAYRTGQLDLGNRQLALQSQRHAQDAATRGFFGDEGAIRQALSLAGHEVGEGYTPATVGDQFFDPRLAQQPSSNASEMPRQLADHIFMEMTGGGQRPLNSARDRAAAAQHANELGPRFGVPGSAIMSAMAPYFAPDEAGPSPQERLQRAVAAGAALAEKDFAMEAPSPLFNPASPEARQRYVDQFRTRGGGDHSFARHAAAVSQDHGVEVTPEQIAEAFLARTVVNAPPEAPAAPTTEPQQGGWGAVRDALTQGIFRRPR